ncbi:hypothetical protein UWK_01048 [Desulfocapsa sulfexigens DSM 10523]|uniref:Uncharacterized protein n=2 Tax=Desulfocapsa TaxID=53318 RepID=M1PCY9_DESSD|nr:hypothetical protein UWK_01048 [Desulfocapsa sulfexigens DSM 10523]
MSLPPEVVMANSRWPRVCRGFNLAMKKTFYLNRVLYTLDEGFFMGAPFLALPYP